MHVRTRKMQSKDDKPMYASALFLVRYKNNNSQSCMYACVLFEILVFEAFSYRKPEVIKSFLFHTQLCMKFKLLISIKVA